MTTLIERLVSLKDKSGLNAKQLTIELGISTTSFTDWGKGKGTPSVETLLKFSDRFNVSLDWLIRGEEFAIPDKMEYSSREDEELINKFHLLPQEYRGNLMGYIDGMLATIPVSSNEKEKRLSG